MVIELDRKYVSTGFFLLKKIQYEVNSTKALGTINLMKSDKGFLSARSSFCNKNYELFIRKGFGAIKKNGEIIAKDVGSFNFLNSSGKIFDCGKRGSNIFNGIYYWEFTLNNISYLAYEVGFGHKGIYCCIWTEGETIAIISKKTHIKRGEIHYTIYLENPEYWELITMINVYWDLTRYYLHDSTVVWDTLNTWKKELKMKYDPTFIPRVKSMDDIME